VTYAQTSGDWILTTYDVENGKCVLTVTGFGGSNGTVTCLPWKQASPRSSGAAATKWHSQCVEERDGQKTSISQEAVIVGSSLIELNVLTEVFGQQIKLEMTVVKSLPAAPTIPAHCSPSQRGSKFKPRLFHAF